MIIVLSFYNLLFHLSCSVHPGVTLRSETSTHSTWLAWFGLTTADKLASSIYDGARIDRRISEEISSGILTAGAVAEIWIAHMHIVQLADRLS